MNEAAVYTDPGTFQAERREVFAHNWQVVGDLAAVAEPGQYVCANLAGYPAYVLRGERGELRAFRNVCRHQQLPVLDNGVGRREGLVRCRYHGWTYDFAGRCILVPPQVRPDDFDTTEYRLDRLSLAVWSGLALVNFAPEPEPLDKAFAGLELATAAGPVERGVVRVFANWKAIVDEVVGGERRAVPGAKTKLAGKGLLVRESPAERWMFRAPSLSLYEAGSRLAVVQVVPRTFLKSEIHWYALGESGATAIAAEELGKGAEARQASIKASQELPVLADGQAGVLLVEAQAAVRREPSEQ